MLHCLLAAALVSQKPTQPSGLCNDQTRHITTMAGNTSTGTTNCASFSFTLSVAGQSFTFSSPASCDTGRRQQDKDCYDCGPASEGNHCDGKGFLANVKIFSIGGANPCPTLPEPLPTSLADASAAVQCAPLPELSSEDNWCASVKSCEGQQLTAHDQTEPPLIIGDGQGTRSSRAKRTFELDWKSSVPRSDFEAWVRALPRDPLTALPSALQGALAETADLEGAEVVGVLDIVYFENGVPWIINRFDFTALVRKGGLHVRQREFVPDEDGEVSAREESLIYDGRTLLVESSGGWVGQAYLPGYFDLPAVLRARIAPYALLSTWLNDPFGVQRLVGTKYESLADAKGEPIVIESYPEMRGPGTDGSTVYRFGGRSAFPRVASIEYRAGDGTTRILREFSAWSEVSEESFRPSRVVETRLGEKGELQRMTTLQLRSAREWSLAQARDRGWLVPRCEEWFVYQ